MPRTSMLGGYSYLRIKMVVIFAIMAGGDVLAYSSGFGFEGINPVKDNWIPVIHETQPTSQELLESTDTELMMSQRIKSWLGIHYKDLDTSLSPSIAGERLVRDVRLFRAVEQQWQVALPQLKEFETNQIFSDIQILGYSSTNYKRFVTSSTNENSDYMIHMWDLDKPLPSLVYRASKQLEKDFFFKAFMAPWQKDVMLIAHDRRVFSLDLNDPSPTVRLLFDVFAEDNKALVQSVFQDLRPMADGLLYRTNDSEFRSFWPGRSENAQNFLHSGVMSFLQSPTDLNKIVSVSRDKVKIWDRVTAKLVSSFPVSLTSQAAVYLPSSDPSQIVLVSMVGTLLVYDLERGVEKAKHYLSWGCALYDASFALVDEDPETLMIKCANNELYAYKPNLMRLDKIALSKSNNPQIDAMLLNTRPFRYVWIPTADELLVYDFKHEKLDFAWQQSSVLAELSSDHGVDEADFSFQYVSSNPNRAFELLISSGSVLVALSLEDQSVRFLSKTQAPASTSGGVFSVNKTNPNVIIQIGRSGDVKVWDFFSPAIRALQGN